MAITPLQLPDAIRPAQVDWTPLTQLGDTIAAARRKQRIGEIVSQSGGDTGAMATALAKEGLLDEARPLFALAAEKARADQAASFHQQQLDQAARLHNENLAFEREKLAKPTVVQMDTEEGLKRAYSFNPATGGLTALNPNPTAQTPQVARETTIGPTSLAQPTPQQTAQYPAISVPQQNKNFPSARPEMAPGMEDYVRRRYGVQTNGPGTTVSPANAEPAATPVASLPPSSAVQQSDPQTTAAKSDWKPGEIPSQASTPADREAWLNSQPWSEQTKSIIRKIANYDTHHRC